MSELVDRVDEFDRVVGAVERDEAIRAQWLHRVAVIVCRDRRGRILVHRRPGSSSRFPGHYNWLIGGAVAAGESYEEAARRELTEELGVCAAPRFVGKFLCRGAIAPYWLGIHEVVLDGPVAVDPSEISWSDWLTPPDLRKALRQWQFVPDSIAAFGHYSIG